MIALAALVGCDRDVEPPRPPESPTVAHSADPAPHSSSPPPEHTGRDHTGRASGETAGLVDTGLVPLRSDSGGPECAPVIPRRRAILTGRQPYPSDCDLIEPVSVDPGPVVPVGELARARIDGDSVYASCGSGVVLLGDTDADGVGEFAVGCDELGEVWAFEGLPSGVLGRVNADSVVDTQGFGGTYLEVGDLLGPGRPALAVSGVLDPRTFVLELPLPPGVSVAEELAVGFVPEEVRNNSEYGALSVGDWDGDGTDDLGISGVNPLFPDTEVSGGLNVVAGPFVGTVRRNDALVRMEVAATDMPWAFDTSHSGSYSRGLVADLTGDGLPEALVGGDRNQNVAPPLLSPYNDDRLHGALYLFDGGAAGDLAEPEARAWLYGTCYLGLDGYMQRPVGDVTGDCQPDVAEGAVTFDLYGVENRGAVLVLSELHRVRGRVRATRAAGAIIVGEATYDELYSVGFAGDLDRDGFDELVVGARRAGAQYRAGRVYVFRGPVAGVIAAADADLIIEGGAGDGIFGEPVRGGRDLDGDGVPDLLVGAKASDHGGGLGSGSAYVFSGADLVAAMR